MKYINFTLLPQNYLPLGWGHKFTFLFFFPNICCIPNLVKIGPVVSEEKMFTDDGRQPIAIGHLSDTGDLKNKMSISKEDE